MKFCRSVLLLAICISTAAVVWSQDLAGGSMMLASQPQLTSPTLTPDLIQLSEVSFPGAPPVVVSSDSNAVISSSQTSANLVNAQAGGTAWRPLTGQERLILFWNDTYASPGAFLALSISSMADEVSGKPAQWDKDGNGYTRRFASGYGQLAARNVIHEGLASLTGQDPRYIPCHCEGPLKRTTHALKMSFTTYSRSGRLTLDVPQLAGAYGSGMVSTYWYPHRLYDPLVQGVQFGHQEMGEVFVGNLIQEFGPDIKRALHLHSRTAPALSLSETAATLASTNHAAPVAPKTAPLVGREQAGLVRNPIS